MLIYPCSHCGPATTAEQFRCVASKVSSALREGLSCFTPMVAEYVKRNAKEEDEGAKKPPDCNSTQDAAGAN